MRMNMMMGVAIAALVTMVATDADAQTRTRKRTTTQPVVHPPRDLYFEEGGPPSANDDQAGGPITASVPPPRPRSTTSYGPFPAGVWMQARSGCSGCNGRGTPLTLYRNGRYDGATDAGTWKLAPGRITFSWRVVGRNATAAQERSAPIRTRSAAIVKQAPNRMTLDGVAWVRCSPDQTY